MGMRSLAGTLLVLSILVPGALAGQAGPDLQYDRIVSLNPLALVVLGLVSADYEQTLGSNTSWGGAVEYFDWRDRTYFSADAKLRYYIQDRSLDGISVGALVGFTRVDRDEDADAEERSARRGSAVSVGFMAENQWLMGSDERLALTVGVGGKRLFFLSDVGAQSVLPMVRLSAGWAF